MVDKSAHYLMCKGGVYYFTRHVPNDLQRHYEKPRVVKCLKTRSRNSALKASHSLASKYLWHKCGVFYFRRRVPNDVQKHYERPYIVISLKTRSKVIFYGQTEPCTTNLKFIRSYKGRRLDQKKHGNLHRLHMVEHEVLEHQSA